MDIKSQLDIIKRGAVDLVSDDELLKKLAWAEKEKRPLCIKAGFDPTAADLHLGHTVIFRKLRQFQELGHQVYFLIGDFTARIGDPTGRSALRKTLTAEEVRENAVTYQKQVAKVLDLSKVKVVYNSHWFDSMPVVELLKLTTHATVAQMLARSDFKKRIEQKQDVSILEFLYPILQGYDSVVLKSDIEIGGTDQIFNLLMGRDMQKDFSLEPQVVLTMPLLEGTDGVQKMSKSYGNYIGINEPASEMFGKIMSISDELMIKYFTLLTDEDIDAVKKMHPKEAKVLLAKRIISQYHSSDAAEAAEEEFKRIFSNKEPPEDITEVPVEPSTSVVEVMTAQGLCKSKNEARRLIKQNAVEFEGKKVTAEDFTLIQPGVLKVGSRRFLKISLK